MDLALPSRTRCKHSASVELRAGAFPCSPDETAQYYVSWRYVSWLRKALERDRPAGSSGRVLVTRKPGYALAVSPEQVDAGRFKRLLLVNRGITFAHHRGQRGGTGLSVSEDGAANGVAWAVRGYGSVCHYPGRGES